MGKCTAASAFSVGPIEFVDDEIISVLAVGGENQYSFVKPGVYDTG